MESTQTDKKSILKLSTTSWNEFYDIICYICNTYQLSARVQSFQHRQVQMQVKSHFWIFYPITLPEPSQTYFLVEAILKEIRLYILFPNKLVHLPKWELFQILLPIHIKTQMRSIADTTQQLHPKFSANKPVLVPYLTLWEFSVSDHKYLAEEDLENFGAPYSFQLVDIHLIQLIDGNGIKDTSFSLNVPPRVRLYVPCKSLRK